MIPLAQVHLIQRMDSVSQTTQGVTGSTAEVQSVAGLQPRILAHCQEKHYFFMMGQMTYQ